MIALSGCGGSSSGTQTSTVKKKAGLYRGVRLEVKNASSAGIGLMLCVAGTNDSATGCVSNGELLNPGEMKALAADEITGNFDCYSCKTVYFRGVNPAVGAPYVQLEGSDGQGHGDGNPQKLAPDENSSASVTIQGQSFTVTRMNDLPDYKVFELRLN